jgi:LAS superfamily LD-carboxypeptidase LdcB
MDLACGGVGLYSFKTTSCYAWLSKNNFENAKKYGWVPSYPEEASQQGPEPEAWEYIWVGTQSLYE